MPRKTVTVLASDPTILYDPVDHTGQKTKQIPINTFEGKKKILVLKDDKKTAFNPEKHQGEETVSITYNSFLGIQPVTVLKDNKAVRYNPEEHQGLPTTEVTYNAYKHARKSKAQQAKRQREQEDQPNHPQKKRRNEPYQEDDSTLPSFHQLEFEINFMHLVYEISSMPQENAGQHHSTLPPSIHLTESAVQPGQFNLSAARTTLGTTQYYR